METLLGLIIGALITAGIATYLKYERSKRLTKSQSLILLDKIKRVCKFITVEGDFAEIYHYEDVKERFLKLVTSRKKALVIINAKAHVGYDFSKVRLQASEKTKTIVLKDFPQPEVLSIETNLNYYDKKDGMFNRFEASDLTELHNEAKLHIMDKVPESGLYKIAQDEAIEAISLIENIVQTIGWKLDYSALVIDETDQKLIDKK
jgi:predicted SPOUT superfamily RNA methylase MTH1